MIVVSVSEVGIAGQKVVVTKPSTAADRFAAMLEGVAQQVAERLVCVGNRGREGANWAPPARPRRSTIVTIASAQPSRSAQSSTDTKAWTWKPSTAADWARPRL